MLACMATHYASVDNPFPTNFTSAVRVCQLITFVELFKDLQIECVPVMAVLDDADIIKVGRVT